MRSDARQVKDLIRDTVAAFHVLLEAGTEILKCFVMGINAFQEVCAPLRQLNNKWAKTVARSLERQNQSGHISDDEVMHFAYARGATVDPYLTALCVTKDPWIALTSQDPQAVMATPTEIWMKV